MKLHPWMKEWILLSKWKQCKRKDQNCLVNNELFLSFDGGRNLRKLKDYIVDFDWFSEDETCSKKHNVPTGRIIFSVDPQS